MEAEKEGEQVAPTCGKSRHGDMVGSRDLGVASCDGEMSEEKRDAVCCGHCSAHAECEFWVRTLSAPCDCFLRAGFLAFLRGVNDRKGAFVGVEGDGETGG